MRMATLSPPNTSSGHEIEIVEECSAVGGEGLETTTTQEKTLKHRKSQKLTHALEAEFLNETNAATKKQKQLKRLKRTRSRENLLSGPNPSDACAHLCIRNEDWKVRAFKVFWVIRTTFLKHFLSWGVHILRYFTSGVATLFFLLMALIIYDWERPRYVAILAFCAVNIFVNWYSVVNRSSRVQPKDCPTFSPKFCYTCKFYRPPRVHHCSFCDACIWRRDHHCFFFGTCVGGMNHGHFIFTLIHLTLAIFAISYFGFWYLTDRYRYVGLEWSDVLVYPHLYNKLFYGKYKLWVISCLMLFYGLILIGTVVSFLLGFNIFASFRDVTQQELQYRILKGPKPNYSLRIVYGDYPFLRFLLPVHIESEGTMDMLKYPYGKPDEREQEGSDFESSACDEESSNDESSKSSDSWITEDEFERIEDVLEKRDADAPQPEQMIGDEKKEH